MDETNASLKSGTTDNKNLKGIISLYVIGPLTMKIPKNYMVLAIPDLRYFWVRH